MSFRKASCIALVSLACGPGASAEGLLPEHLRLATGGGPLLQAGAPAWLSAQAPDDPPAVTYLTEATASAGMLAGPALASGLRAGRWVPPPPLPSGSPDATEPGALIEALTALGAWRITMTDYLSLALPGLLTSTAASDSQAPAPVGRHDENPAAARPGMNFQPDSGTPAPQPDAATRQQWALPTALSEQLTRYLFLAAAAALVAGAVLGLAQLVRRRARYTLARL